MAKGDLEKQADELLRADARAQGFIKGKNLRGYGDYTEKYGLLTSKQQSEIAKTEKFGFTETQLESLMHGCADAATRRKYGKS